MDDAQQQRDEVEVLQSIFANDITVHEPNIFDIIIQVNLPYIITVKLPAQTPQSPPPSSSSSKQAQSSTKREGANEQENAQTTETKIKTLPPLTLHISYPPDYPSFKPPNYSISSCWLSTKQLLNICEILDNIWNETKGDVIVFRWVSWLKEEYWDFMKNGEVFTLQFDDQAYFMKEMENLDDSTSQLAKHLSKVQSECSPFSLPFLIQFNHEESLKEFLLADTQTCSVCYCDSKTNQFNILDCGHYDICSDCVSNICLVNINNNSVDKIVCPVKSCKKQILPHVIQKLISPENFEKYERITLERGLQSMDDVMWCPKCSSPVIIESDDLGACTKCFFNFCTNCSDNWHPGNPCINVQTENKLKKATKEQSQRINEELTSERFLRTNFVRCPNKSCRVFIEKFDGCNKITCGSCKSYFCWVCLKLITGYTHFQSANSCPLFEAVPERRGDVMVVFDQQRALHEIRLRFNRDPNNVKRCPRCKFVNMRNGNNNHVVCANGCGTQFCFLCLSIIHGTTHFTSIKSTCKQHSIMDQEGNDH